jgi:dihydroorotate dehydrogenase electron transfer subunit
MSISYTAGNPFCGFSARAVGPATEALHRMNIGERIGIRGPYGNGFSITQMKRILVVAGGTGAACLAPLIETLSFDRKELSVVLGARTASELLFLDRVRASASETRAKLLVTTDDGSYGSKGFASEQSLKLLDDGAFDEVYTCGPEPMMVPIVRASLSKNIPIQVSLERYMKCGVGLCGSCVIGPYRVCRDGPVFNGKVLAELQEFGQSKRDATGAKQQL